MEADQTKYELIELIPEPAFCVRDGVIQRVNRAARSLSLAPGMEVLPLLLTGIEEYPSFVSGCLSLQLQVGDQNRGATVTGLSDAHVFLLDSEEEDEALRAMALAARELRQPLSNLIAIMDNLLPRALTDRDGKDKEWMARLSRGLYQMERTIGNMSDAGLCQTFFQPEVRDIPAIFEEIFEKAEALLSTAGAVLHYTGPNQKIYGLIDARLMERAVWNVLSNALKFQPTGCEIHASLTWRGQYLRLCIQDNGPGMGSEILGSLFTRYRRQPGLEDSRYGIGLGMRILRSAAICHGGTVLIDQPGDTGTRVSLTMLLQKGSGTMVRTPGILLTGGRDSALIELSDCLPLSVYEKEL